MIARRTRGGTLVLFDQAPTDTCATCPARGQLVGLQSDVAQGPADGARLETSICADCLAEALALLFGRRHVQDGGDLTDLSSRAAARHDT